MKNRPAPAKESQIQSAIEEYLKLLEGSGRLCYIKNNSGAQKTQQGSFLRFGKKGSPDFLLFRAGGKCVHLEVKSSQGRQTDSQRQYQSLVESLGHRYAIVRSVGQAKDLLEA
ncbi:MAG: hypothetical protein QGG39_18080 [Candidatus Poribacteria bacterium]|nr:hypothetical protein [Candidatus Poribacteria bacterium]